MSDHFIPDWGKKLYTVTIDVFENCQVIKVAGVEGYKPKYQELIGVLDVQKTNMIVRQSDYNRKEYKKQTRKAK